MQQAQTWQDNPSHWRTAQGTRMSTIIEEVTEYMESRRNSIQTAIDELREGKPEKAIIKLEVWLDIAYQDSARDPRQLARKLETSVEMALGSIEIAASDAKRLLGWITDLSS